MRIVARWETKGKDFIELREENGNYWYIGNGFGGGIDAKTDEEAIECIQNPWGHIKGAGAVTVLKSDRPSLKRVPIKKQCRMCYGGIRRDTPRGDEECDTCKGTGFIGD